MKIMNVSLTIDVANVKQVEALERLMRTLGDLPMVENLIIEAAKPFEINVEQAMNGGPSKTVTEKATRSRKAKTPQVEEPDAEMAQCPSPADMQEEQAPAEEKINIATLRALTAEKAPTHRAEIKEKLAELGAANVTSIPEESYNEYHDFITSL
jgi:hypothetical protein